jgi:hypothetical protein
MLVANIHMCDSMPPDLNEEFTCEPSFVKILRTGQMMCKKSTFIVQISEISRSVRRDDCGKDQSAHCTSFLAYLHHNLQFCMMREN